MKILAVDASTNVAGCAVLSALPIWGQKEGRGRETFGPGIPVSARAGRSAGAGIASAIAVSA